MTIENNYEPEKYIGTGSVTEFSFDWYVISQDYIRVYLEDVATGVQVLQTLGSDFTLAFDQTGGIVTFLTAPTSDDYVIIAREVDITQETRYTTSQGFQGNVIENDSDKAAAISQDLTEIQSRTLSFPLGTDLSGISSDYPTPLADALVGWNATATALENRTTAEGYPLPTPVLNRMVVGTGAAWGSLDVDDSTIEINSATLRVKDLGITSSKITADGITDGYVLTADSDEAVWAEVSSGITPKKYINGLKIAFVNVTTVSVSGGDNDECIGDDGSTLLELSSNTNAVLSSASNDTSYYLFLSGADTLTWTSDITGAAIIGAKRMIFAVLTDGSGDIQSFNCNFSSGFLEVLYTAPVLSFSGTINTTFTNVVMSVPLMDELVVNAAVNQGATAVVTTWVLKSLLTPERTFMTSIVAFFYTERDVTVGIDGVVSVKSASSSFTGASVTTNGYCIRR